MAALLSGLRASWFYGLAITPSLIGLTALLPWSFGWTWPGPSLAVLGLALLVSPLIDRTLAQYIAFPVGWLRLRIIMAGALGGMTLIIAADLI